MECSRSALYMDLDMDGYSIHANVTQQVLICGMSNRCFMRTVLQELDCGPQALLPGSSITLFNQHTEEDVTGTGDLQ